MPEPSYFDQDSMVFKVVGKGHEIGLKMQYPYDAGKEYEIEVRKHGDPLKRSRSQFLLFVLHGLNSDADHLQGALSVVSVGTILSIFSRTLSELELSADLKLAAMLWVICATAV